MRHFQLAFVLVLCLALQSKVVAKLSLSFGNRRQAAASVGRLENVKAEGRFNNQFISQLNTLKGSASTSTCPPNTVTYTSPEYMSTSPSLTTTNPTTTNPTSATTGTNPTTATLPAMNTTTARSLKNRLYELDDDDDDDDDLFLGQNFANHWVDSNIDDDDVNSYDDDDDDNDFTNGNKPASTESNFIDEQNLINGRKHQAGLGRAARASPSQWQLQRLRQRNRRLRQQQRRRAQIRRNQQRRRRRQRMQRIAHRRRQMRRRRQQRQRRANNRRLRRFRRGGGSNNRRIIRLNV